MMISRRKSLILLAGGLASPALGQNLRREPLPEWIQATRLRGKTWQDREGNTFFFSQKNKNIMRAKWQAKTQIITSLSFLPDPTLQISQNFFDSYQTRNIEKFDKNPAYLEDICWPGSRELTEKVWTSFGPKSTPLWNDIIKSEDEGIIDITLPNYTSVIWLQPTNDENDEKTGPDLDLSQDGNLENTINGMLKAEVTMAGTNFNLNELNQSIKEKKYSYLAKIPPSKVYLHTHVYFRIFTYRTK